MRVAITGGTGFVGRHLAERLNSDETVVISRRTGVDVDDVDALTAAFQGVEVVAHCAGINREIGTQTFQRVHIEGTQKVIDAAKRAGVRKIILMSFLRARPNVRSGYHRSKFAAEELVRNSGLDYTVLKPGMIYGHGDHMVDHLTRVSRTLPIFPTVGFTERTARPIPVDEMTDIMVAAVNGELSRQTVAVMGGEELKLSDAIRRVSRVVGRRILIVPFPVWVQYALAQVWEWTMKVPLAAKAQVRMLAEGVSEPAPPTPLVPEHLRPTRPFDEAAIRAAMPDDGGFHWSDLRWVR